MKNLFTLSLAISASIAPGSALAGAWLQEEGRGQVITATRVYATTQTFDKDGDRESIPLFTKTELSPYFEYGVTPEFTIGGEFSLAAATNAGTSTQQEQLSKSFDFQFSYANIFGRSYLFKSNDFVVSLEPGIDFPFRINPDLTSDGDHPIPQIKLNFGYGYQRWEMNNFIDGSIQYRYRNLGDLNDMIKSELTIGYHITDYFIALAQISNETTLGSTRSSGNYNLTKPQLSILYDEREHEVKQFGVFTNLDGRNAGAGYGAIYSVWYRF